MICAFYHIFTLYFTFSVNGCQETNGYNQNIKQPPPNLKIAHEMCLRSSFYHKFLLVFTTNLPVSLSRKPVFRATETPLGCVLPIYAAKGGYITVKKHFAKLFFVAKTGFSAVISSFCYPSEILDSLSIRFSKRWFSP